MSTPTNHHFVPEVYLKEFANSQKQLFSLRKKFPKVTVKTVAQVCYKPNYFKLHSKDNLTLYNIKDHYHIEKSVFKKHENSYPKLVKKVTQPSISATNISKSELALFFEILITIKKRNPTYRERVISDYKNYVTSEQFRKDAEVGIELAKTIDTIDPVEYFENYIKEASTDENKQSDMYLRRFLAKQNENTQDVINTFLEHKIYMYHAPFGIQFITSDNPGFTLLPNGELLYFGGLGLDFKFLFPLTPKCCLFITHGDRDTENRYLLDKTINLIHTDKATVAMINNCTYNVAIEKVFAYGSGILDLFAINNNR